MKVISYMTGDGTRVGLLVDTKAKYHYVLLIDNPLRIRKLVKSEERYFRDVEYKGEPYPVNRAKRHIRRMIKNWHGGMRNVSKDVKAVFASSKEDT